VITQTLAGSSDVGFVGSQSIEGSRNFTISDQFENQNLGGLENDRTSIPWESLTAIAAAIVALSVILSLVVFLLKRHKGNQRTDLGLEYETETEANVVTLQECESGDDQGGAWNVHDFERTLEPEFGLESQQAPDFSDQRFPSDCAELF
jgi:hypothetical protein